MPGFVGRPAAATYDIQLRRALTPMVRQIRASLKSVRSLGDVRALGAALRRRWSDKRIRAIVAGIGTKAEAAASRPWHRLEPRSGPDRKDAAPYDADKLLAAWSREAFARIVSVRGEIAESMRRDIVAAAREGIPAEEVAAGWRRTGIPIERGTLEGRIKVIAQNQLSTLHAQVQSARARAIGVEEFIWRTQGDDRVRDAHQALEGSRHRYDDPPSEGLPGTPINCFLPDTELFVDDGFVGLSRRVYRGEMVEIHLRNRVLVATPNHPVGTLRGWVPAGQLQPHDHVIDASGYVAAARYHDGVETQFQKAWDLLQVPGSHVFRRAAFHGDASVDDQVHVVGVDRGLVFDGHRPRPKRVHDLDLAPSYGTAFRAGSGSGGLVADSRPAHGVMGGGGPALPLFWASLAHALDHCGGAIPDDHAVLGKPSIQHVPGPSYLLRDFLERHAGLVTPDQVLDVRRRGKAVVWVHNAETSSGIYVAQGTVVHNCRCWAESVIPDALAEEFGIPLGRGE